MNSIDLIKSLIGEAEKLGFGNDDKVHGIRIRAKMLIRKIFGSSSPYLGQLERIIFSPAFVPSDISTEHEYWNSGQAELLNLFNTMLEDLELSASDDSKEFKTDSVKISNKIFIVHGHDKEMKLSVEKAVKQLELNPIILHDQANDGKTIIEKFTKYSDVGYAIVLLSPDDMAYAKGESPENAKSRARQNVILELGFFLGKLGRERVLPLSKKADDFEMPSDYNGVIYTPYDDGGGWKLKLVKELQACGYNVDANKLNKP